MDLLGAVQINKQMQQDGVSKQMKDALHNLHRCSFKGHIFKNLSDKQSDVLSKYLDSRAAGHMQMAIAMTDTQGDESSALLGPGSMASETDKHDDHGHHEHHHHGHHEKEPSLFTAVAAGLINYLLMFGFCCAYGMIMFMDPGHKRHRALAIKMNLGTAMVMGLLLSSFSKVPVAIGGPDMNPVIFSGVFVQRISEDLLKQLNLEADPSKYSDDSRRLGASKGPSYSFCVDDHLAAYEHECEEYHAQLRATVIFAISVSSGILALLFLGLGALKLTRYVAYVPTSIVDAFLSCMGYKVFKHGLKLCKYKPQVFIPAAAVGVPLYFLKASHTGNPAVIIPLFMLSPVAIFYALIYATGWDVTMARKDNLMFPKVYHEDFYQVWQDGFFSRDKINYQAWWETKYDLLVMMIVCLLDCLVTALRTTEAKIPVKVKKNYETMLYGLGDIGAAVFGSTAGYMQLKMNVINYGIMGNIKDRRAGILCAMLMAASFFGSIEHLNYIPRLFLGMLLFFGGSGFVAEHLWGSRDYLSFLEWMQVFIILGVFILTDEILYSVTLGGVLCGITFIAKYAKIPCISGRPMCGGEVQSREQHTPLVAISLSHIANSWLLVIRLKGFIFFASVQTVTDYVRGVMEQETNPDNPVPPFKRVKFVLLDCELLDGLDSSAEKDLQHLAKDMAHNGVRLLWSHVKPELVEPMVGRGTIRTNADWFTDIDDALLYIQGLGLKYRMQQQVLWERLHPAFELNQQLTRLRDSFEPFFDILRLDVERFGCPWDYVGRIKIQKCKTLLWAPGEHNRELFLVHTGAVGLFREIPGKDGKGELERPVSVYRHGWFLNRESIMRTPTRFYALALEDGEVLYWNRHEWWRMHREQPLMASAILEAAMRQASSDMERMAKALRNNSGGGDVPEAEQALENIKAQRNQDKREHGLPKDMHQLPEDLEARLEGIEAAQHLETFGLYQCIPEDEQPGLLPALPRLIQHDLEVAFQTYCSYNRDKDRFGLPWEKVSEALMYAGIFNTLLVQQYKKTEHLTQSEFLELANEAALMRLSNRHITKIYNIFREYKLPGSEMVSRDDLIAIFENTFMPHITEQEVNGIANTWEDDGSGMINCSDFTAIISRFARRHEQDWNLLRGLREILNKKEGSKCTITDVLTAEKLCKFASTFGIGDKEKDMMTASEMMWCAACYSKLVPVLRRGEILDWTGCCAAVLLNVDSPSGKLPPAPKKARENTRRSLRPSARLSISAGQIKDLQNQAGTMQAQPSMAAALMGTMGAQSSIRRNVKKEMIENSTEKKARFDEEDPSAKIKATKSAKPSKKSGARASRKGGDEEDGMEAVPSATRGGQSKSFQYLKQRFQNAYKDIIKLAAEEVLKMMGPDTGIVTIGQMGKAVMDLRNVPASEGQRRLFVSTRLSRPEFEEDEMEQQKSQGKRFDPKSDSSVPDTPDAKIYLLLEDPTSSTAANIWSMVMAVFILFSVGCLFLKSLISKDSSSQSDTEKMVWKIFECLFTIVFLSELVVRFAVAPALGQQTYCDFLKQPLNVCDAISVLPFFIELMISGSGEQHLKLLRVARFMRLVRIARIARLAKKSSIAGPVAAVFTIIWGIYLKESG